MASYSEIEDADEISNLQRKMRRRVEQQAPYVRKRSIGFPSGQFEAKVHFARQNGGAVVWWLSRRTDGGVSWLNLIGRGDPNENHLLMIDLQLNMVEGNFHRRLGGTFVREDATGVVFVAHRGIVTRGMSRVPWERLVSLTTEHPISINSSAGSREMFLVAAVESGDLLGDIARFAQEIREALDRKEPAATVGNGTAGGRRSVPRDPFEITLREFVAEFAGRRALPQRKAQMVVVRHGAVVRALRDLLAHVGKVENSQKVDLFVSKIKNEIFLFEVKTATDTTSIYTGVGQLFMHSVALSKHYNSKQIRKVLVIPGLPTPSFRERVRDELGIDILTYAWGENGAINFEALKAIDLG